ncbi:uncharacterized protein LOC141524113 isoform X1 [Cotesia typhae]|uniref:uncharacterized protein LOC141524113 isoform X1 n=1 Tax=Cotesia typhae TaxID=2053667 RepID=UPI003D69CF63
MTIFKVSQHDKPSMKKLVKAETMTELIDAARVKLSLTENVYKIFMEDFTEIDDDDILQELATSFKEQLSLTLVPDGIEWSSDNLANNTPIVSNENLETDNQPCQSLLGRQTSNLDSIYVKLPSSVQEFLSRGTFLDPDKKKSLIHVIEKYMSNDLKNTTRGTARDIGKQLVNKYPASFTVKNLSMDAAGASLGQKIYDRINYVKQDQIGNEVTHSYSLHDLEEPARKPKVQDEYGCVAYMPELPSTETWESQE